MNLSAPFIARPVATTLITLGIALAGCLAFLKLPVSPLPQVDFPTILVQAQLPGASPETVASSLAEPLERHLGQISHVTEMTSASSLGTSRIILQFDISRDIDGAARDVQAAINAAMADLPTNLPLNPTYRKINPADTPSGYTADVAAERLQDALNDIVTRAHSRREGPDVARQGDLPSIVVPSTSFCGPRPSPRKYAGFFELKADQMCPVKSQLWTRSSGCVCG